jgi:hypothetical protein
VPHDWLLNMGGSIGMGLPVATGVAIACPERKVATLEGDRGGMYTCMRFERSHASSTPVSPKASPRWVRDCIVSGGRRVSVPIRRPPLGQ